jgi:hypothetical protein
MFNWKNIARCFGVSGLFFESLFCGTVFTQFNIASASQVSSNISTIKIAQASRGESNEKLTVEDNDFRFKFKGCTMKGKKTTCAFLVTNLLKQDRTFHLYAGNNSYSPRIIDTSGDEYFSTAVQVGKSEGTVGSAKFIQNIPLKASVTFEIPQGVTKLASLELIYQINGINTSYKVEYRDVKIGGSL